MLRRKHRKARHPFLHLFLGALSVLLLVPIVFTVFYSFFPKSEMSAYLKMRDNYDITQLLPILLSPKIATLRQYYTILIEDPTYLKLFLNSLLYAGLILSLIHI